MKIKFANSASKHSVSKQDVSKIINSKIGFRVGKSRENRDKIAWVSNTDSGYKIEIIAIDFITYYFVIHAMPIYDKGGEENEYLEDLW